MERITGLEDGRTHLTEQYASIPRRHFVRKRHIGAVLEDHMRVLEDDYAALGRKYRDLIQAKTAVT